VSRGGDAAPITVSADHTLQVGDTAYFMDDNAGYHVERKITAIAATTITVEGPANVSVADLAPVSANLRIGIYRTLDGGLNLYLVDEIPNNMLFPTGSLSPAGGRYIDDALDDELTLKHLAPLRSPDPFDKVKFLVAHQNLLVGTGGRDNPNTVFFSEPDNIEASPLATNSFDIPFTTRGPITGIVSDEDVLIVFKQFGRAIIRGDVANNAFVVDIEEDGIGCYSHHAIAKTPVGVIFPSRQGFQRMRRGILDTDFPGPTSPLFYKAGSEQDQTEGRDIADPMPVWERSVAVDDYVQSAYLCYVPTEEGIVGDDRRPVGGTTWYVFDYKRDAWIDDAYENETDINAYGGMAMFKNALHLLSSYSPAAGKIYSNLFKANERGDVWDAYDNTEAINWELPVPWDHSDEPSVFKLFLRLKTWMFANPEEFLGGVLKDGSAAGGFTLVVETFLNFGTTVHSLFNQVFSAITTLEVGFTKLKGGQKAQAMQVKYSNNTRGESPVVTGYEYEVTFPYRPEGKE